MTFIKKQAIMLFILILFTTTIMSLASAQSDSSEVTIYFFWGDGCPHCAAEKPFLEELQQKYPDIEIKMFETWKNPDNAKLFNEVAKAYGTTAQGVPTTFIGDKFWVGYADYLGNQMEEKVIVCIQNGCESPINVNAENLNDEEKNQEINTPIKQPQISDLCIHIFIDVRCDECNETQQFIESLQLNNTEIIYHDINNESEKELYEKFKEIYGLISAGYPVVFIGDTYLIGLNSIKNNLEKFIENCENKDCTCPVDNIKGITSSMPKNDFKPESKEVLELPIVGIVDLGKMPLLIMTGLIAFVDGFNPCSLWVLTFLLGIVIYSGSRKKIFLVGLTFLLVTATAYGLFMLGLLNVFTYVGYTFWIKLIVALIAMIFAVVNIKDYFWYKKGISFTISDKHKPKFFKQVRDLMNPNRSTVSMLVATAIMALGIVLVELPCTAGFPMIWTNIISQNNVSGTLFVELFLVYMIIYLLDEIVVFIGVTLTLKASKFEEKHGRILKLIGGMIMLALAFALVFMSELMNSLLGSIYVFGIATITSFLIIFIHRKILPKYGIKIGSEFKEHKNLEEDDKNGNSK